MTLNRSVDYEEHVTFKPSLTFDLLLLLVALCKRLLQLFYPSLLWINTCDDVTVRTFLSESNKLLLLPHPPLPSHRWPTSASLTPSSFSTFLYLEQKKQNRCFLLLDVYQQQGSWFNSSFTHHHNKEAESLTLQVWCFCHFTNTEPEDTTKRCSASGLTMQHVFTCRAI